MDDVLKKETAFCVAIFEIHLLFKQELSLQMRRNFTKLIFNIFLTKLVNNIGSKYYEKDVIFL